MLVWVWNEYSKFWDHESVSIVSRWQLVYSWCGEHIKTFNLCFKPHLPAVSLMKPKHSHMTSIFHVVSRKRPETLGFSARHVIDLPSSSVVGTKLRADFVMFVRASSCKLWEHVNELFRFMRQGSMHAMFVSTIKSRIFVLEKAFNQKASPSQKSSQKVAHNLQFNFRIRDELVKAEIIENEFCWIFRRFSFPNIIHSCSCRRAQ